MKSDVVFRFLAVSTAFAALLSYGRCMSHFCKGGHMRHPPYSSLDDQVHFLIPALLLLGIGFAWKSDMRIKIPYIVIALAIFVLQLPNGESVSMLGQPVLLVVTLLAIFGKNKRDDGESDSVSADVAVDRSSWGEGEEVD